MAVLAVFALSILVGQLHMFILWRQSYGIVFAVPLALMMVLGVIDLVFLIAAVTGG